MNGEGHTIKGLLSPATTWADFTLFGESIPHLLHWDFAYLWILQRDQNTRPAGWAPRVEAWRRLLCMLLLNELQLETRPIPQPLLSYTQPRGFSQVTFVSASNTVFGKKAIGVISPTVIVRPLPEPNRLAISAEGLAHELPALYQPNAQTVDRRQQLLQTLEHAKLSLRQSGSLLARSLENIISSEIAVSVQPSGNIYPVTELPSPVPLLHSADAAAWENPRIVDLRLMVAEGTTSRPSEYVPKCSQCEKPLTFSEAAPPVEVAENISIVCAECGTTSPFELVDFGVFRDGQRVYVWRDLHDFAELGNVPVPPSPKVVDHEIRFQWNPGMLHGDAVRTHLRLRFLQASVTAVSPRDIKYARLLIPGDIESFSGHPIRPEWLFAIEKLPSREVSLEVIKFRNMQIKGLRFPVSIAPYPLAACKLVQDLQVGVYPQPLYPQWQRYRIFWSTVSSPNRYRLGVVARPTSTNVTNSTTGGVLEWHDTVPYAISLEESVSGQKSTLGATWQLPAAPDATAVQPIYVGVDFGTTTSIVYVDKQEGSPEALTTEDLIGTARLLSGIGPTRGSFLPPSNRAETDPTFIPSALWFGAHDEFNPVRWNDAAPSPDHHAVHGFKWGVGHELHRRQYLQELLFLMLPAAVRRIFPYGGISPNWKLGFAFPLAFSDPQRAEYVRILKNLQAEVQKYAGGNPAIYTINESFACVRAFGQHGYGEVFLIADLGGGSLDLALFELVRGSHGDSALNEFHVGSAKIGGESFVEALARRIGVDPQSREREYWHIRDAITTQSTTRMYGGSENYFAELATRFVPIAQELMRIMAAACAKSNPDKIVQFVLVGNGWRIAEYNTGVPQAEGVARKRLEESFGLFGLSSLRPYGGRFESASKHLVAIGALQNAKPGGRNELEEAAHQSKMPAGRDMKISRGPVSIPWSDLVGSAIQNIPAGASAGDIEFDRKSGPQPPPQWRDRIEHAMPDLEHEPSDAVIRDHMNIRGYGLEKGPLQIMLEKRAEDLS